MEIIFFITGTIFGAIIVFFAMKNAQKNITKAQQDNQIQTQLLFENIANKIIKENTQDFSTQSKERINELLEPFKEKIEEIKKKFEQNNEKFTTLDVHIKNVIETGNQISKDTHSLTSTLKSDNMKQGKWGELVLERVLELSGLKLGEEYLLQRGSSSSKPDATILLPENKAIFIDAKTTLNSFDAYINAENEEEKLNHLKNFKESVKSHITGLSKREYFEDTTLNSPEYVLMFIPIESCYSLLFTDDSGLWEFAWKNKVMPTSPSTLLAAMKIIHSFHTVSRQNKNAMDIANLAGRMIDKFAEFIKSLMAAKKSLDDIHTKLIGKDNIIAQMQRLQEMGAKSTKEIPVIESIE